MKKLNLSDLENSDIKYKISQFPDGQQDIVIITNIKDHFVDGVNINIEIQSRFNSFKDLELIICATKSLRRLGIKSISLYIPYLLGSRSDREFQVGGNSYLVDVIAPIINSLEFIRVTTIDVHSDVATACIKNLKVIDNFDLACFALKDIIKPLSKESVKTRIISPDAGSEKKIYKLLEKFGWENKNEVIVCSKYRDIDGSLSRTIVPLNPASGNSDLVIIDDICDGGRTFINIAKYIREEFQSTGRCLGKIHLIVTHGIFSAGYEELNKWFDGIYCTNSIKDIGDFSGNDRIKTNIKQLKVI